MGPRHGPADRGAACSPRGSSRTCSRTSSAGPGGLDVTFRPRPPPRLLEIKVEGDAVRSPARALDPHAAPRRRALVADSARGREPGRGARPRGRRLSGGPGQGGGPARGGPLPGADLVFTSRGPARPRAQARLRRVSRIPDAIAARGNGGASARCALRAGARRESRAVHATPSRGRRPLGRPGRPARRLRSGHGRGGPGVRGGRGPGRGPRGAGRDASPGRWSRKSSRSCATAPCARTPRRPAENAWRRTFGAAATATRRSTFAKKSVHPGSP